MHVLLDENLDWRLAKYFDSDFQVTNVNEQGWTGKRDSELLRQAAATFDVLVTMDKGIEYQQNISKYAIGVIIIFARSSRLQDIQPVMLEVNQVLRDVQPGQVIHANADVS